MTEKRRQQGHKDYIEWELASIHNTMVTLCKQMEVDLARLRERFALVCQLIDKEGEEQ